MYIINNVHFDFCLFKNHVTRYRVTKRGSETRVETLPSLKASWLLLPSPLRSRKWLSKQMVCKTGCGTIG